MGRIRKTIESVSVSVGIGSSRAAYVVTVLRTDPERMWVGGEGAYEYVYVWMGGACAVGMHA